MAAKTQRRTTQTTSSHHDRRLARRLEDPEFRAEYERELRQIQAIDELVHRSSGDRT